MLMTHCFFGTGGLLEKWKDKSVANVEIGNSIFPLMSPELKKVEDLEKVNTLIAKPLQSFVIITVNIQAHRLKSGCCEHMYTHIYTHIYSIYNGEIN